MTEGIVRLKVRYSETDQMGFVHHPHYLIWCEIGRTELMRELGFAYSDIERNGLLLAVAEASLRYARPARYDDDVRIVTRIDVVQSRSLTFSYRVLREVGADVEVLATAMTKLIAIDTNGSPKRLPSELLQRFRDTSATPA
jgi:acyl-CoA thioester hydrolase